MLRADSIELAAMTSSSPVVVERRAASVEERSGALTEMIEQYSLAGNQCQLVLSPGMYQILQVDRPNVPDEEMVSALRWSIKDLVPIPAEQLVLDYFDSPVQTLGQIKLNVVACDKELITPFIEQFTKADVNLVGISVEELALTCMVSEEAAQLLLFHAPGDELLMLIVKQGQLYFSRRLRGYNSIHQMSVLELTSGPLDNLSLELQRSMDYMQRQLRQEPVSRILVAIQNPAIQDIVQNLQQNVEVPVSIFEVSPENSPFTDHQVALGALEQLALQGATA